jgi:hypothetical protein
MKNKWSITLYPKSEKMLNGRFFPDFGGGVFVDALIVFAIFATTLNKGSPS